MRTPTVTSGILCAVRTTESPRGWRRPPGTAPDTPWEHIRGPASSRLLVQVGAEHGVEPARSLAGSGLSSADLADPSATVTAGQEILIAANLRRELGDLSGIGLQVGRRFTIGDLGIWAYALMSSPTYGEAVRVGLRFSQLTPAFVAPELDDGTAEVLVVLHDEHLPLEVRDLFVERDLAAIARLMKALGIVLDATVLETRFADQRAQALAELFEAVDVRAARPAHRLRIPMALISRPMPMADPGTREICERECERLLQARSRRTALSAIVRARLVRTPQAMPSLAALAAELHTSQRSLRRHLEDEGTSYRALREEVAKTLATELLSTVGLSVSEVATRLGYSDASSFTHAFTRWTGAAPSTVRETRVGRASDA